MPDFKKNTTQQKLSPERIVEAYENAYEDYVKNISSKKELIQIVKANAKRTNREEEDVWNEIVGWIEEHYQEDIDLILRERYNLK